MMISKDIRSLFSSIFMIVIMLFLYSCSESKSEESGEGVEEVSFDYSLQFNDIDIMSADSLRYQLAFDMVGIKSLNVSIEINDIPYNSFNIVDIDSSDQVIDGNLPFNQQSMNIRVPLYKMILSWLNSTIWYLKQEKLKYLQFLTLLVICILMLFLIKINL